MVEDSKTNEALITRIASAKSLALQAVQDMVKKKQDEFSGLLTPAGAAQLVAQELGVDFADEADAAGEDASQVVPLADAEDQCDVFVRVHAVFAPKGFEKNGRKGRVCNVLVSDGKTKASLVLWNRDVDLVEYGRFERNDFLLIKNAQVKSNDPLELQSSMLTRITVKRQDDIPASLSLLAAGIPANAVPVRKFSELSDKDLEFDAYGRVLRVDEEKEFVQKDGRKGKLATMLVSDGTANTRLVLWDKNADMAARAKVGDAVKIEGAYAKKAFNSDAMEVNVGWKGRAFLHPHKHPLGEKGDVLSKMYPEKSLSDGKDGDEFISQGTVMSIESAAIIRKCRTCKATVRDSKCEKCGDTRTRELLVVSTTLNDGTKNRRCAFFDAQARELLGVNDLSVDVATIVDLKREYLIGKKVRGVFSTKLNAFSGDVEATARHVISVE